MPELLVVTACLYQKGCTDTANVYYDMHPEYKEFVLKVESRAKATVGPTFLNYAAPVILVSAGAQGAFKISNNLTFKFTKTSTDLIFQKDF